MSVVIVNTLLTSVMEKLAKFERHVSLSDYTSTVTAKLALAQFLNTALIVIIVNAGYTGGGLEILKAYHCVRGTVELISTPFLLALQSFRCTWAIFSIPPVCRVHTSLLERTYCVQTLALCRCAGVELLKDADIAR